MSSQDEMEEEARPERRNEGESSADARIIAILPARENPRREENDEDKIKEGSSRLRAKVRETTEWGEFTENLEDLTGAYERRMEKQEAVHKERMAALRVRLETKTVEELEKLRRELCGNRGDARMQREDDGPREAQNHRGEEGEEERRYTTPRRNEPTT